MTWNARSLNGKQPELLRCLEEREVQVLAVQESHLNPLQARLGDYDILQGRHPEGQGVALFIHRSLTFRALPLHLDPGLGLEVVGVTLPSPAGDIAVASVYALSGARVPDNAWATLSGLLPPSTIFVGDFNAHHTIWGCHTTDRRGLAVEEWADSAGLLILNNGSPTRTGTIGQRDSALDLALIPPRWGLTAAWEVLGDSMGSDHHPCLLHLPLAPDQLPQARVYHSTRRWVTKDEAAWQKYHQHVALDPNGVLDLPPSLEAYGKFVGLLCEAMDSAFPRRREGPPADPRHRAKAWWNQECAEAVTRRAHALEAYQTLRSVHTYEAWRQAHETVSRVTRAAKRRAWRDHVETLSPPTSLSYLWRMARRMNGTPRHDSSPGEWLEDFLRLFAPDPDEDGPPDPPVWPEDAPDDFGLAADFTLSELRSAIATTKDTAPGMDGITSPMLKNLPERALSPLLGLMNFFWRTSSHPAEWRNNLLLPLLKPGKPPDEARSYRPIALTSVAFKIFERMLKPRIEWWAEANRLLDPHQFGFRKGSSTSDALGLLVTEVLRTFSEGQYMVVLFADIASAYNSVRPHLLLQRLQEAGAHPRILNNLRQILYDQQLYATYQGRIIGPRRSDVGFGQGWVSSPLLYILDKRKICADLPNGVGSIQLADDIALYAMADTPAEALNLLRPASDVVAQRLQADGARLSPGKSHWILFSRRRIPADLPNLHINGDVVPRSMAVKYLGVWLTPRLSWTRHISESIQKCKRRIDFLRSLAGATWGCHPSLLLTLYKTTVRPVLEYAAGPVFPATKADRSRMQRVCSAALRVCMGAMPSSPIVSLLVEAAEWPIDRRLTYLTDRLLIRWRCQPSNPAYEALTRLAPLGRIPKRLRARPPHIMARLVDIPPPPPQPPHSFHTWPIYSLHHSVWHMDFPIFTIFPPAPVTEQDVPDTSATFSALLRGHWCGRQMLATDGSRAVNPEDGSATVGAAFIDTITEEKGLFQLHGMSSVFLAEALAILKALQHARDRGYPRPLILTDSMSTLQALRNPRPSASTPPVLVDILRLLRDMYAAGSTPELQWIPAHKGIDPNEMADAAANLARGDGIPGIIFFPPSLFYGAQRSVHAAAWKEEWRQAATGRHLYSLCPSPPPRPWFHRAKASRRAISAVIRLRIGHNHTPAHLHRVAGLAHPGCICGAEVADAQHIFNQCLFTDRVEFENEVHQLEEREGREVPILLQGLLLQPSTLLEVIGPLLAANPTIRF